MRGGREGQTLVIGSAPLEEEEGLSPSSAPLLPSVPLTLLSLPFVISLPLSFSLSPHEHTVRKGNVSTQQEGVIYKPGSSPSPASDSTGTGSGLGSLQTCEKGISSFKSPRLWCSVTECKLTKMTFKLGHKG